MMGYYFDPEDKKRQLGTVLESWLGTKYRHQCGVKGLGCDCIHFTACVMIELGVFPASYLSRIPAYPKDWHIHNTQELLLDGIIRLPNLMETNPDDPQDGDIILYKFGRVYSHSAIFFNGSIFQALTGMGVTKSPWTERAWFKRKKLGFRVICQQK